MKEFHKAITSFHAFTWINLGMSSSCENTISVSATASSSPTIPLPWHRWFPTPTLPSLYSLQAKSWRIWPGEHLGKEKRKDEIVEESKFLESPHSVFASLGHQQSDTKCRYKNEKAKGQCSEVSQPVINAAVADCSSVHVNYCLLLQSCPSSILKCLKYTEPRFSLRCSCVLIHSLMYKSPIQNLSII